MSDPGLHRSSATGRVGAGAGASQRWSRWPAPPGRCSPSWSWRSTTSRAACSCWRAARWWPPARGRACCAAGWGRVAGLAVAARPWRRGLLLVDDGYLRVLVLLGTRRGGLARGGPDGVPPGRHAAAGERHRGARWSSSIRGPGTAGRPASAWPRRRGTGGSSRWSCTRATTSRRSCGTAVDAGADAVAMAGGDGSQAVVAAIAAEAGLPYACIPAGTRNHFALDLGVDRDDVVGALDAFVDGGERVVDLGEVNGRVFVNNVSLGRLRRGGAARRLPGGEDADPARHGADSLGRRRARSQDLRWTTPGGRTCTAPRSSWSATTSTGSAGPRARARVPPSTRGCSASPWWTRPPGRRPGGGPCASGRHPSSGRVAPAGARGDRR